MSDVTGAARLQRGATNQIEDQVAAELEKIPGVLAATVWLRDSQRVREVYLTGAPGTSRHILEQAVIGVLRHHRLDFTTRQLQISPIDLSLAPPLWRGRFLVLEDVEIRRADHQVACTVKIMRRGVPISAEARDVDTERGRARAATLATLRAAELSATGIAFGLEGLRIHELFGRRYVILSIEAALARNPSLLPGIAAISDSVEKASALATLGAIERWLNW